MKVTDYINIRTYMAVGLLCGSVLIQASASIVHHIPMDDLSLWEEHSFKGHTLYQVVEEDGRKSIKAVSDATASGMVHRLSIDLDQTPYLYWSWRVDDVLDAPNEQTKQGDDYPARIYVVKDGGWMPWRTRSINYVWSSSQAQGSVWPSAYTSQSMMVAVRSGTQEGTGWYMERRNLKEDFKQLFGEDVNRVDLVALMTDADNTGASAVAWYADLYFSSE